MWQDNAPKCDTKLRFTVKSDSYGDVGGGESISSFCCWVAWKFDRDETGENGCCISVGRKFVPAASRWLAAPKGQRPTAKYDLRIDSLAGLEIVNWSPVHTKKEGRIFSLTEITRMTLGDVTSCGTSIASCYAIATRVDTNISPWNFDISFELGS